MNLWKFYYCATNEKQFLEYVKGEGRGIRNIEYVALSPRAYGNYQEEHFIFSRALEKYQHLMIL